MEIANLLLRESVLTKGDPAHDRMYAELLTDATLFEEVRSRLALVGYGLEQFLGHVGVRLSAPAEGAAEGRNRQGLHAGHVRMIVYLWVHLVYREWSNLRNETDQAAPGREQRVLFGAEDEGAFLSYRDLLGTFKDTLSVSALKGVLSTLRRLRFIRVDERRDRLWADAALYTMVDRSRMEDFVVGVARRLGSLEPAEAVELVALGSPASSGPLDEGSPA